MKRVLAPNVMDLALALIDLPEDDLRVKRDQKKIDELAKSMKKLGQLVPILVKRKNGGRYEIIDGYYRYLAAKRLGWEHIKAIEAVPDLWDEDAVMIHTNIMRANLTPLDVARRAKKLMEEHDMDLGEVAKMLNLSKATVSKCIKIYDNLSEEDKQKLLEGKLTFRQAYARASSRRVTKPRMRPCGRCGEMRELKELKPIFLCPNCYEYVTQQRLGGEK